MASSLKSALIGLAALGGVAAAKGATDIARSRTVRSNADDMYEAALARLEAAREPVHQQVVSYGQQVLRAVTDVNGRFADWIVRNRQAVNRLGHHTFDGLEVTVPELPAIESEVRSARLFTRGGVAAAGAAIAAPQAALAGVAALASASTGTPIAALHGVAATNATLAWLGGGSLASGGGGVAAGGAILNLVAFAPAAFIGGLTVAVVGSKQRTHARQYAADREVAIEHVQTAIELMPRISRRIIELSGVLDGLVVRATAALDHLEALHFDPDLHGAEFRDALQLVRAVREVANTTVLDPTTGEPTPVSLQIVQRYQ